MLCRKHFIQHRYFRKLTVHRVAKLDTSNGNIFKCWVKSTLLHLRHFQAAFILWATKRNIHWPLTGPFFNAENQWPELFCCKRCQFFQPLVIKTMCLNYSSVTEKTLGMCFSQLQFPQLRSVENHLYFAGQLLRTRKSICKTMHCTHFISQCSVLLKNINKRLLWHHRMWDAELGTRLWPWYHWAQIPGNDLVLWAGCLLGARGALDRYNLYALMRHSSLPAHRILVITILPMSVSWEKWSKRCLRITSTTDPGVCGDHEPDHQKGNVHSANKVLFLQNKMCWVSLNMSSELRTGVRISSWHGTCRRGCWWSCTNSTQVRPGGEPGPRQSPLIVIIESLPVLGREHKRSKKGLHLSQILHSIAIYILRKIKSTL